MHPDFVVKRFRNFFRISINVLFFSVGASTAETLDWNAVCTRAEGTGWFPVIVPGCAEALTEDGYGSYGMSILRSLVVEATNIVAHVL